MAYSKKRKVLKRKRSGKPYLKRRVPKKYKSYVKKEIARQIQNKTTQRLLDQVFYTNVIADTDVYTLMPAITQGDGQADRDGNKVRIRKATMRFAVASLTGIASSSQYVDVFIFKMKQGTTAPTAVQMAKFMENGNGSVQYSGLPVTRLRPINKDIFILKKKMTFLLAPPTTGANGSLRPAAMRTLDITDCFKKQWCYDDVATAPTNENLFMAVGATDPQTQSYQNYGKYSFCVDFEYEDA